MKGGFGNRNECVSIISGDKHFNFIKIKIFLIMINKYTFVIAALFLCFVDSNSLVQAVVYEPLPVMPYPPDNLPSSDKEKLGFMLFIDKRLSGNNKISCSTCHLPDQNWIDMKARSAGFEGIESKRNAPTILNSGFNKSQFWDGRAATLEEQAVMPITNPNEMNQSIPGLIEELEGVPEYVSLFERVFGDASITIKRITKSIATFERTLVTKKTRYDLYWMGNKSAMSSSELRGMKLFFGKAKCSICHNGPLFTDHQFHNIGISLSQPNEPDIGRAKVTGEKFHIRAFKTPGLRYISRTAPYMHDGSLNTLEEVVEFYDSGGVDDPFKSPFISAIGLTAFEKKDLVDFLKSLDILDSSYEE